jgi:CheY-like chemotaxis protein
MCIYLPRHYGDAEDDRDAVPAGLPRPGEGRHTVMVVDDEPTIRMLVVEIVEELGHTVLQAGDGAAALRLLENCDSVDLLITDVGLPGQMNGRQVADAAVALLPRLKVLFITGYAENAVIGNGPLAPNMALVTKPFGMDVITDRIRAILAG